MSKFRLALLLVGLSALPVSPVWSQGATLVVTDQVTEMEFHDQITLTGRSEAIISSRIVAEVAGPIASIDAAEGIAVSRGERLVTIDPERVGLTLASKEAEAARRRAQAKLAERDLKRTEDLFSQELISESRLDSVRAGASVALQTFKQLEAERDRLALDLANCRIKAPFSGYTVRHLVDIGEWVDIGTPVLEMVDLSQVKVMVDLPERHFGHVAIGSPVTITLRGGSNLELPGKVTGIAPSASAATHTFPVIITADNKDGRMAGGMLVRVSLNLSERFSSLAIPKDALVRQGNQTMVYTIVEGKASPVPVMISSSSGEMIAVSGEGLSSGMKVVVRGNERIFPGSQVRTAEDTPTDTSSEQAES